VHGTAGWFCNAWQSLQQPDSYLPL
jgi:hypothetical protein